MQGGSAKFLARCKGKLKTECWGLHPFRIVQTKSNSFLGIPLNTKLVPVVQGQ